MMASRVSRRPKGFGLFDTGNAGAPQAGPLAHTMPVLTEEVRPNYRSTPEVEAAMRERHLEFKRDGCLRVEIGRGAFAKAYLALNTQTGTEYVVKEVDLTTLKEEQRKKAGLEVTFLKSLNHVNVVRCLDAFNTANVLHIVLEFASKGTLAAKIDSTKSQGGSFSGDEVLRWLAQLCAALRHLHGARVLHRDLKTANVFLDGEMRVKLGDFGLSRKLEDDENFSGNMVGTPYYFAPEVVKSKPFSNKTDVWSAGVIAYETAFLKKPFQAKSMKGLYKRIAEVNYEAMPDSADPDVRRLISSILLLEPRERPSASKLCHDEALRKHVSDDAHATPQRRPSGTPATSPEKAPLPAAKKKSKAVAKMLQSVSELAPPLPKESVNGGSPAKAGPKSSPLALPAPSPGSDAAEDEDEYGDDFEQASDFEDFEDADEDDYDYEDDFESYDDSLIALHDS